MKDKTNYCYNRARTYLYEAQRGIEFVMSGDENRGELILNTLIRVGKAEARNEVGIKEYNEMLEKINTYAVEDPNARESFNFCTVPVSISNV